MPKNRQDNKVLKQIELEIEQLDRDISMIKNQNKILKLNVMKKELILKKLKMEQDNQ